MCFHSDSKCIFTNSLSKPPPPPSNRGKCQVIEISLLVMKGKNCCMTSPSKYFTFLCLKKIKIFNPFHEWGDLFKISQLFLRGWKYWKEADRNINRLRSEVLKLSRVSQKGNNTQVFYNFFRMSVVRHLQCKRVCLHYQWCYPVQDLPLWHGVQSRCLWLLLKLINNL